ncbi:rhodanese-like domain-containing protein [Sulfurimonas sp.]|uniref:rhodanese-like domain-containing protein n=1 Tax=Sulfurimonas sp. TaxID=2022749 RepID=UPI002AB22650|nr:rhodanese-like domain-containing protein [Sulfurimonas sp.]
MTKIFISFMLLAVTLLADLKNEYPTQKFLNSKIPIVDIRTPPEWVETGIVKDAITIMFFNEQGSYDIKVFLAELNKKVDTTKPFALICRTGSRTKILSQFLSKEIGYDVINLQGGMMYVKGMNLPIVSYKK